MDSAEALLREVLAAEPAAVRAWERAAFDHMAAPFGEAVVLFGAGPLGRRIVAGLRSVGVAPLAFVDDNAALHGTAVDGLAVVSPAEAAERFGDRASVVISAGSTHLKVAEVRRRLRGLGFANVLSYIPLFWKYPETFLPHLGIDLPHRIYEHPTARAEAARAFALWADEASRREFVAQLRQRIWLDFAGMPPDDGTAPYVPNGLFVLGDDVVFVDCGAYDGDTIDAFLAQRQGRFGQIVALEPDPANVAKLRAYVGSLDAATAGRIQVVPAAVGARSGRVRFAATGTDRSAVVEGEQEGQDVQDGGGYEVPCVTLDEVLGELADHVVGPVVAGARPAHAKVYVKMDIEGAEPDALRGSRGLLQTAGPVLAVCAYHRPEHLWSLPLLIHELAGDRYRLYLRRHRGDWEIVLYAVAQDVSFGDHHGGSSPSGTH